MKVTGLVVSCDRNEFDNVNKIMNLNGYYKEGSIIESIAGITRAQFVKREDKISEFENIFDF
jgi:hypothetical protein